MQVPDTMQVVQRKGKPFSLFWGNQFIDVDGVNRLITLAIATTVAKKLPASGETSEKDLSHTSRSLSGADAAAGIGAVSCAISASDVGAVCDTLCSIA
jgi:hypothetical protein